MGKLAKASSSSSPVNLSKLFISFTNDVITRVVLGKKYSTEGGEYISQSVDMLFGAAPTTFTLLEWTMTEFLRHPECALTTSRGSISSATIE
ncbi:hypothetical protein YC2023_073464 [Brassica napus]